MSLAQALTKDEHTAAIVTINGSPYHYCESIPGLVCNGFRHYTSAYEWTQGKFSAKRKRNLVNAPTPCPHEYFNIKIFRGMKQ